MNTQRRLRLLYLKLTGGRLSRRMLEQRLARNDREIDGLRDERKALRIGKNAEKQRADRAESQVRRLERKLIEAAPEPPKTAGCDKVRFHREAEAGEWLVRVAAGTGQEAGWFEVYPCNRCPRSPLTDLRYLHVKHVDPELKLQGEKIRHEAKREAARDGLLLGQRVSPAVMAKLRQVRDQSTK